MFEDFTKTYREKSSLIKNPTKITVALHEDTCTFMIISRWIIRRTRNVSDKNCKKKKKKNQNTRLILNNFLSENCTVYDIKKVKLSHYRPGQALRAPGCWGSQIPRQLTHESGKVVSPTHRPSLPPGNTPSTHFCYRLSQLQSHNGARRIMSMKNSNDTIGNRTRDLPVCSAQSLNQLRHRVPPFMI